MMKKMIFGLGTLVFVGTLATASLAMACPCEKNKAAAADGTVKEETMTCDKDKKSCGECTKCAKETGKACSCKTKTKES